MGWLIAIFCLIYAILCWRSLPKGLALLVFLLPTYLLRFQVLGIPFTLLEAQILILFGVFVINRIKVRQPISFSNYKWLMLAFVIIGTVAVYFSPERTAALGLWKAFIIEPILFFLVLINSIKEKVDWDRLINYIGASSLLLSILCVWQKLTGQFIPDANWAAEATRRVTGWYGYPNGVGLFLAPIVILFLGILIHDYGCYRSWLPILRIEIKKIFYIGVIVFGSVAIYFAQSEGAMVAVAIGGLLMLLVMKQTRKIGLVLLILGMLSLSLSPVRNNIIEKATFSDFSGNLRLILWQETTQMLSDNFAWGGGLANFKNAIEPYHHTVKSVEVYPHPHNVLLVFWTELGILGLIVMTLLVIQFYLNYFRVNEKNKPLYVVLLIVLLTMLVHGIVDAPYFKNDLSVWWWVVFGLSAIVVKGKESLNIDH